jgi:hypothetical protein
MRRSTLAALGGLGLLVGGAAFWSLQQRRTTEQVPYTVLERLDGVEVRQYPPSVAVETEAASDARAFGRLFRYISGANRERTDVSMTAPVETLVRGEGRQVAMTAPVRTSETAGEAGVRMSFYLPVDYDYERAPEPTEEGVHLVAIPERVAAVRRFTWWATDGRVARQTRRLERTVHAAGYTPVDDPSLLRYDAPWALPFLRRNEVAVTVRPAGPGRA